MQHDLCVVQMIDAQYSLSTLGHPLNSSPDDAAHLQ